MIQQQPVKEGQLQADEESKSERSNVLNLWVARHGQTQSNVKKTIAGHRGDVLTSMGVYQARKLCKRLSMVEYDHAYCSDLNRTVKTLKPLADENKSLKITYSQLLRQKGGGELQGQPLTMTAISAKKANIPLKLFRPKGGESWRDVFNRARRYLNIIIIVHLLSKKQDSKILTVTHGGWIMEFLDYLKSLKDLPQNSSNSTKNTAVYYVKIWFDRQKAAQLRDFLQKQKIFQCDFKALLNISEDEQVKVLQTIEKQIKFSIQYANDNSHLEQEEIEIKKKI